jgi:predicted AAA+ superfamily ATPase
VVTRQAAKYLRELASAFPIVAITGPRQSGKTTLARMAFAKKPYVSFENPDVLWTATQDPRAFLARYQEGAIFDEAQRFPDLFSYLQQIVDEDRRPGHFVLTGSRQFGLHARIAQSLAGRAGLLQLLPFLLSEAYVAKVAALPSLNHALFSGFYPAIHSEKISPRLWYGQYVQTYVERDVRQLINVRDLATFQRFVGLCAGRVGQLLDLSSLGADCGVTHHTARAWLSALEASYIVFLLRPYHVNLGKRLIKTPKLYFYDTGLLAWLLSIDTPAHLDIHSSRGAVFESFVASEIVKAQFAAGRPVGLYFWRDQSGHEVDFVAEDGQGLRALEAKSGSTLNRDFFKGLHYFRDLAGKRLKSATLIYGGGDTAEQQGCKVLPWYSAAKWAKAS